MDKTEFLARLHRAVEKAREKQAGQEKLREQRCEKFREAIRKLRVKAHD